MRMKALLAAGVVAVGMSVPGVTQAQEVAQVTVDLNLRVGAGTDYGIITTIPSGVAVTVYGCTSGYSWCDVEWDGYRGWVYSRYLAGTVGGEVSAGHHR